MYHLVARTADGAPSWTTWPEGVELFRRVVLATPGLVALVVMPNHVHLVHPADVRLALAAAMSGYTRWRDARRAVPGPPTAPLPPAEPLADADKLRRTIRYVHLNPCRARLVEDPLAWPLSTHRDATGLAVDPVVPPRRRAADFHAYVSADPSVAVDGTELPRDRGTAAHLEEVRYAVSALTRTPLSELARRGPARSLLLRAARTSTAASTREIAAFASVSPATAASARPGLDPAVRLVSRVVGDPRFPPLDDAPLRWRRHAPST